MFIYEITITIDFGDFTISKSVPKVYFIEKNCECGWDT